MLSILGKHIDSLYLSVDISSFPAHLHKLLDAAKLDAQTSGDDLYEFIEMIGVPGGMFYIAPRGSRGCYHFVLTNARMRLEINAVNPKQPAMKVQFKAECVYEYDLDGLEWIADRVGEVLFGPALLRTMKVSRVDVAVDFQDKSFRLPDRQDVICRAHRWSKHGIRVTETGLTLGQHNKSLQAVIYNKTEELKNVEKDWMLEVFRASGKYEEGVKVWRVEMRFYRVALHSFGVSTVDDLRRHMGDLLAYSVGDETGMWLRVATISSRGSKSHRRSTARWWRSVRSAFVDDELRTGKTRARYNPRASFEAASKLAGHYLARAAAIGRLTGETWTMSAHSTARVVVERYNEISERGGIMWPDRVNVQTARLRAVAC